MALLQQWRDMAYDQQADKNNCSSSGEPILKKKKKFMHSF